MKKFKKGFTIVELVIVIAVIAVLTAVLVPTFIHLTNKANKASDQSLVTNLNKALAMRKADKGEDPKTMHEAVEGLKEYGFGVEQLVTKSGEKLVYDLKDSKFYLEGSDDLPSYNDKDQAHYLWRVQDSVAGDEVMSVYASQNFNQDEVELVGIGFDAGSKSVSSISYQQKMDGETPVARDVVIRTNGGDLTIDAENDTVRHFGHGRILGIEAIASASYHENGIFAEATIDSGHMVVESNGFITKLTVASTSSVNNSGYVAKVTEESTGSVTTSSTGYVYDNKGVINETTGFIKVYNFEQLQGLATMTDLDFDFETSPIQLQNDIDMKGRIWTPFGSDVNHPFSGVIDGNNHKILNMSDSGSSTSSYLSRSGTMNEAYGLIAYGLKNIEVKNLVFENTDIQRSGKGSFGTVLGAYDIKSLPFKAKSSFYTYSGENLQDQIADESYYTLNSSQTQLNYKVSIKNVTVHGNILTGDKSGGFIGTTYIGQVGPSGVNVVFEIDGCTNDATMYASASNARLGGFVGCAATRRFLDGTSNGGVGGTSDAMACFTDVKLEIKNSTFSGKVYSTTTSAKNKASALVAYLSGAGYNEFANNTITGKVYHRTSDTSDYTDAGSVLISNLTSVKYDVWDRVSGGSGPNGNAAGWQPYFQETNTKFGISYNSIEHYRMKFNGKVYQLPGPQVLISDLIASNQISE